MIDLILYSRKDLSNFLQIAQQADNDGYPLPCYVVEQVVEAHDIMLLGHTMPQKKTTNPQPPCVGCTVAKWITFSCGKSGWECQGNKTGKCRMVAKNG